MDNKVIRILQELTKTLIDTLGRGARPHAEFLERLATTASQAAKRLDENNIRAAGEIINATEPESVRPTRLSGTPSHSAISDVPDGLPSEYLDLRLDGVGPATVGPVRATAGPGATRAHVLASRVAFHDLPGAAEHLDDFLLGHLGPRKIVDWSHLAAAGAPGLLVARGRKYDRGIHLVHDARRWRRGSEGVVRAPELAQHRSRP
ncbi:hypothetical protein AB0C34_23680 [Nocardia sp. NPDC049220]|uniref:hypothetical protein n=1 Tax=Nocardia sp. NPDC049220 TaxID=3155273 RepID=UPI0033D91BBA